MVGGFFAPAYLLLFPDVISNPNKTFIQKLRMVDWVMTVLFVAGSCSLTMAISFGGLIYDYNSGSEIALWTVTGVLLILTVLAAKYHPGVDQADRLYPVHFFRNPVVLNMQIQIFMSSGIILVCQSSVADKGLPRCSIPQADETYTEWHLLCTALLPIREGRLPVWKRPHRCYR